jgi:DNA-binding SARP family transcriptional activator/energy-coupling factor transporter ATP-binding protein EcfA2
MDGARAPRFQVLGPLEVRVDADGPMPLGGFMQRLLLAALLMNANAVVSVDRLVDVLWGDSPRGESASTLAKQVYRLRGAFGSVGAADVLLTRPRGYLLSVDPEQLDAARFTTLLSGAQQLLEREPARALAQFDAALGLWRGPAWVDFADHDFARADAARLDGLRAAAVEDRAQALLALGRHSELIPQLEVILGEYPLRERPRAQLMQALYAAGRQADALAVYREFRGYLRQEIGLEPSASLRAIERDILQQKPIPGARPRPTVTAAPTYAPGAFVGHGPDRFVGRSADLAWLEILLGRAAAGEGPVLAALTGDAGIGKTSLVTAFARVAHARGACVVFARCDRLLGAVAAIANAIGQQPPTSGDTDAAGDSASYLADALGALSGPGPLLLILDDLDFTEAGAGSLLELLSTASFAARWCAVATARTFGGDEVGASAGLVARNLTGLERADVAELLRAVSGASRPDELVDSVCAETAGVPALVTGIGRRIRDEEITARAKRAVARAEEISRGLRDARSNVTLAVLARDRSRRDDTSLSAGRASDVRGEPPCPYKGLAAFGAADAEYFCGRDRLVAETVAALTVDRFLGVIGASGSGKSSLVAAGLVPALAGGGLPGSDRWRCLLIRPGPEPMRALARALAPLVNLPAADVHHQLETDPGALASVARQALEAAAPVGERLVLIVDQFEEVFTACADHAARDRFLRALVDAVSQDNSPLAVVVAMRADYYGACAEHVELARLLGQSQVLVTAMTEAELRRAVLEPARRAGLAVEEALVEAVCADALSEPGGLPLVSTALLQTWIRRSGHTLTLAGFAEAGGVRGAVARLAEGVYHSFDPAGRAVVRRIFLRLADPGGPTTDVRRRAAQAEVAADDGERAVLVQLINRRLVTATEDTVEVAHEALLREWPRLRGWLEEDRDGRRLHRQLGDAATAWDAEGRDEAGLYRGVRRVAPRAGYARSQSRSPRC